MRTEAVFAGRIWFSESWEESFLLAAAAVFTILWVVLRHFNRVRPTNVYDPHRAWLRAGQYFIVCFVIGWASGVLPTLLSTPLATPEQSAAPLWLAATLGLFLVIAFGYGVVWRQGTVSHGRPLHFVSTTLFGILWGLSAGQLLLSVWAVVELSGFGPITAAVCTYLVGGMLNGLWHAKYWDIKVSPDHNIIETNTRKILLAHTPNLSLCLVHMVVFGNPHIFVLAQTMALTISALVMHFPPFWGPAAAMVAQHDPAGRPRAEISQT